MSVTSPKRIERLGTVPIVLVFYEPSPAVGTKKGKPSRLRVHPSLGSFDLEHVEIETENSASVTVDVNKGAGDGAASTVFTTQANRPATSGATRDTSGTPDITEVSPDDYFEFDIDGLAGVPGGLTVYIRGYKPLYQ